MEVRQFTESNTDLGYISGAVLSSLTKGQNIKVGKHGYVVTVSSKPRQDKGSETLCFKSTLRLKRDDGVSITGTYWQEWEDNRGRKRVPTLFGNAKWNNLSRDIEGDVTIDLINERNPFHTPSDSYRILKEFCSAF